MVYKIRLNRLFSGFSYEVPEGKSTRLAQRVWLKLKENDFTLNDKQDILVVCFKDQENTSPRVPEYRDQKWIAEHIVDIPAGDLENLESNVTLVAEKLVEVLCTYISDPADKQMIHEWVSDAAINGEHMEAVLKRRKYCGKTAVLSVRYLDNGEYLPVIRVYNAEKKLAIEDILPCTKYLNVLEILEFKNKCVTVRSRKNYIKQQSYTVNCESIFRKK